MDDWKHSSYSPDIRCVRILYRVNLLLSFAVLMLLTLAMSMDARLVNAVTIGLMGALPATLGMFAAYWNGVYRVLTGRLLWFW